MVISLRSIPRSLFIHFSFPLTHTFHTRGRSLILTTVTVGGFDLEEEQIFFATKPKLIFFGFAQDGRWKNGEGRTNLINRK